MRRHLAWFALPALALALVLCLPVESFAQRRGGGSFGRGGWGGGGWGRGYGGWGRGYGSFGRGYGYGYGGYGGIGLLGLGYGGWGWGYPGWGNGGWGYGGYSSPYYSYSPYYSAPIYSDGYATAPITSYPSFYPSDTAAQPATDGSRAYVHVRVPGNAQVLFNNAPTEQSGPDRTFVTPQLDPNQQHSYDVTAQWMENGQQRRESRTVRVTPGQTTNANFMSPQNDSSRVR
jgi:uncharacterized protein (TIGR03000 family)